MAGRTKPRRYRPRGVNPSAHMVAIMGAAYMSQPDVEARADTVREAVERCQLGTGTRDDWRAVGDAVNVLGELISQGVCRGSIESVERAICAIMQRMAQHNTRALYADERQMLGDLADVYAEAIAACTQQQYLRAQSAIEARTRRILSGETGATSTMTVVNL